MRVLTENFLHFRDGANRPIVTLCRIVLDDKRVGYGWSICSPRDNPIKKVGRNISRSRAMRSFKGDASLAGDTICIWNRPIVRDEAHFSIYHCTQSGIFTDVLFRTILTGLPAYMRPPSQEEFEVLQAKALR